MSRRMGLLKFKIIDDYNEIIFNDRVDEKDFPKLIKKLKEKYK